MNRKLIFNLVATFVVLILVGTALTFAWYTNTNKSSSMDYVSNGLVLSYKIEDETNVEEYNIKDVVFFDVDSTKEGKYFTRSAVKLTLDISNYSLTPVDLTVKQNIQPFTLSNSIENNVMTIYKYEKANVNRDSDFTSTEYYVFSNETGYSKKTAYEAGNTYFTKEAFITSTITVEDSKIKSISSVDKNNAALITTIDNAGTSFIVGKYQEATNLTKDAFNAGVYYTLADNKYSIAKTFNSETNYYEVNTMAYVGALTMSGTTISNALITTTGAYVSCVITDTELADNSSFDGSLNSYIAANNLTNDFSTTTPLTASTGYGVSGGTKRIYLYMFGIQLFDNATSNFLENSRNVYPFSLIITATQA